MKWLIAAAVLVAGIGLGSPAHADTDLSRKGDWAYEFLTRMQAPQTKENVGMVIAWLDKENTQAQWNPLATSMKHPNSVGSWNSHGVQEYQDVNSGLEATVQTVANGYRSITAALRTNNQAAFIAAPGWKTYSGGSSGYAQGIQKNFQTVMANYETKVTETLRSAPGPAVTASPEQALVRASITEKRIAHSTEPAGLQLRYPLALSLGLVGLAGWMANKRRKVLALYGAVAVMLLADASSGRFEMNHVLGAGFTGWKDAVSSLPHALVVPVTFGGLAAIGLWVWGTRTGHKEEILKVLRGLHANTWKGIQLLASHWVYGAWAGAWMVMVYFGAEAPAVIGGMILAALVGYTVLNRVPAGVLRTEEHA